MSPGIAMSEASNIQWHRKLQQGISVANGIVIDCNSLWAAFLAILDELTQEAKRGLGS